MPEIGDVAPQFCLPAGDERKICLDEFKGKWLVLYFYPKDNTGGCTREAVDFTAALQTLRELGAEVVGISRDSPASHKKFTEKHSLGITLLSDGDHKVTEAYEAWALKKMYGKESYGVIRSTFLIDPEGRIARIWRKVAVKGHVEKVISALKEIKSGRQIHLARFVHTKNCSASIHSTLLQIIPSFFLAAAGDVPLHLGKACLGGLDGTGKRARCFLFCSGAVDAFLLLGSERA